MVCVELKSLKTFTSEEMYGSLNLTARTRWDELRIARVAVNKDGIDSMLDYDLTGSSGTVSI